MMGKVVRNHSGDYASGRIAVVQHVGWTSTGQCRLLVAVVPTGQLETWESFHCELVPQVIITGRRTPPMPSDAQLDEAQEKHEQAKARTAKARAAKARHVARARNGSSR